MKTLVKFGALLALAAGIVAGSSSCVMEERIVEVVLTDETCAGFVEYQTSVSFVTEATIDYAAQIAKILEKNDVPREKIVEAHLVKATYGVTSYERHSWTIGGEVTVERGDLLGDSPQTLFEYATLSLDDALGKDLPAALVNGGVGVINQALDDFIAGGNPILVFRVNNSAVSPIPSISDVMAFVWRSCIMVQVVTEMEADVPDPL